MEEKKQEVHQKEGGNNEESVARVREVAAEEEASKKRKRQMEERKKENHKEGNKDEDTGARVDGVVRRDKRWKREHKLKHAEVMYAEWDTKLPPQAKKDYVGLDYAVAEPREKHEKKELREGKGYVGLEIGDKLVTFVEDKPMRILTIVDFDRNGVFYGPDAVVGQQVSIKDLHEYELVKMGDEWRKWSVDSDWLIKKREKIPEKMKRIWCKRDGEKTRYWLERGETKKDIDESKRLKLVGNADGSRWVRMMHLCVPVNEKMK